MLTLLRWVSKKIWPTSGELRVLLLGLDGSGKSTLHRALQQHVFGGKKAAAAEGDIEEGGGAAAAYRPTTGQSVAKGAAQGRMWCVTDVGGGERQRRAWSNYFADAHFVAWLVDTSTPARLDESARCFKAVLDDPALEHCPVCIVPTKHNVAAGLPAQRLTVAQISEAFGVAALTASRDCTVLAVGSSAEAAQPPSDTGAHTVATALMNWLATTAKTSARMQLRAQTVARLIAEAM